MGGANATPPALVAAVSNAGGMGFFGAAYNAPEQIARDCADARALTSKPFGLNLFVGPELEPPPDSIIDEVAAINRLHDELGIPPLIPRLLPAFSFDDQLAAVIASDVNVFSFTFGALPGPALRALHERGVFVVGTATTVEEAIILERSGVDAIAAQGSEAGAHRGTFAGDFEMAMVGTMALVPQIVRRVRIPVIAAGGIMDGRGIAAALSLCAQAVQMGTAFLVTDECGVAEAYKEAVLSARDDSTRLTRAFSGRPARGIVNRAMRELEAAGFLDYPYQNSLTRAMRTAAAQQNRAEYLSLWCGQGAPMARRMPAGDLVRTLVRETDEEMSE